MSTDDPVSEDDRKLFRQSVAGTQKLQHDDADLPRPRPAPLPRQRIQDEQQVIQDMLSDPVDLAEMDSGEELLFSRPGIQHRVLRKLRRGQFAIEAELDLHRMTSEEARQYLTGFLSQSRSKGNRCVRIIHGKGLGSFNKLPVLKTKLNHWLQQREDVLAFCSCTPAEGGTGAVYVLLKRSNT